MKAAAVMALLAGAAAAIAGPRPLGCRSPHYAVNDYPADMLFEGAFGEMHRNNPSADPAKLAAQAGFRGSS